MAIIVDPTIEGVTTSWRDPISARARRWTRTHGGGAGNRLMNWGWRGAGRSFVEGAASGLGFYKGASGKLQFLGGQTAGLKGFGVGALAGGAVYAMTDDPLLGIAGGAAGVWATGSRFGATGKTAFKMLGPAFIGLGVLHGFQQEGLVGGVKALGSGLVEWGLWNVGFGALGTAFKGTAIGGLGSAALTLAAPVGILAGLGYAAYKGTSYLAERGRSAVETEFAGDQAAFTTQAAYTMRQRALQEISRSHTNSRTLLGNEATLMHLR